MTTVRHRAVAEALQQATDDAELTESLKDQMRSRRIVKALAAMRATKHVTQQEIADLLGTTQSKVSKLENGTDADLRLSDLEAYAKATGSEITIMFSDRGRGLADQIKHHAFSIRAAFLKLVELAKEDYDIAKGVAGLHVQAFRNINRFLQESAEKLPVCPENKQPYVRIAPCTSSSELNSDDCESIASQKPERVQSTIEESVSV